jgi:hypothetical protein
MNKSYREQRLDQRWKDKASRIKAAAKRKCVNCGSNKQLTTHHGYYHPGKSVWDYDDATLWCLCWPCHERLQPILTDINIRIATINPKHYAELLSVIKARTKKFKPSLTEPEIAALIAEDQQQEAALFSAYSATVYENNELGGSLADQVASEAKELYPGLTIDIVPNSSQRDCTAFVDGPADDKRRKIQMWFERRQENT